MIHKLWIIWIISLLRWNALRWTALRKFRERLIDWTLNKPWNNWWGTEWSRFPSSRIRVSSLFHVNNFSGRVSISLWASSRTLLLVNHFQQIFNIFSTDYFISVSLGGSGYPAWYPWSQIFDSRQGARKITWWFTIPESFVRCSKVPSSIVLIPQKFKVTVRVFFHKSRFASGKKSAVRSGNSLLFRNKSKTFSVSKILSPNRGHLGRTEPRFELRVND